MSKTRLYICVTRDKYELPLAVADTPEALAKMCGVSAGTVLSVISHAKQHKYVSQYKRVVIDDD